MTLFFFLKFEEKSWQRFKVPGLYLFMLIFCVCEKFSGEECFLLRKSSKRNISEAKSPTNI